MNSALPLTEEKKLMVTYRVEPGCLGPTGDQHVRKFCQYAEQAVLNLDADFIRWRIVPRFSKSVSEIHYSVNRRQLSHDKADQYLAVFGKSLDEFEGHLNDKLAELIDTYWMDR